MLLPSAFSCDGGGGQQPPPSRALRPKLPSFAAYQPQPSTQARPSPLSSSCRALHAILGAPATIQQSTPSSTPRELGHPFMLSESQRQRQQDQFQIPPQQPPPPHRSANKRRRSEFEEDLLPSSQCSDVPMEDCRPTPQPLRTPKRRRRIPLSMPMGLSADDFRALEAPKISEEEEDLDMPIISPHGNSHGLLSDEDSAYGSSPSVEDPEWTHDDDRMLVETVLEKLRLSKHDWNDCARKLGKDRDSLGRRWSLLVGEGNVGLRRGGRISRTELDISSW